MIRPIPAAHNASPLRKSVHKKAKAPIRSGPSDDSCLLLSAICYQSTRHRGFNDSPPLTSSPPAAPSSQSRASASAHPPLPPHPPTPPAPPHHTPSPVPP